jgi:hypothetical protein
MDEELFNADSLETLAELSRIRAAKANKAIEVPYAMQSVEVSEQEKAEIEALRAKFGEIMTALEFVAGSARYLALARTALEESCMWAIKSVTHNGLNHGLPPSAK